MCEAAADFYENVLRKSNTVKPRPHTDSSPIDYNNVDGPIPKVTLNELLFIVQAKCKKKCFDAHGISNFMLNFLDQRYWFVLLKLFYHSVETAFFPKA